MNWIALRAYFRLDDGINCGNCFICITNMIEKYFKYLILIRFTEDFDGMNVHYFFASEREKDRESQMGSWVVYERAPISFQTSIFQAACRCNHCNHFITFSHFILGSIELFMTTWVCVPLRLFCFSFIFLHHLLQIIIHSPRDCILNAIFSPL